MNFPFFTIVILSVAVIVAFAIWKPMLFNKLVLAKRLNPAQVVKEGDFAFAGNTFQLRMKWMTKNFQLFQLITIKLYYRPGFGNRNENCIDIVFEDGSTALFDALNNDHQKVLDDILLALGQSEVDWSTLLLVDSKKVILYKAPLLLT